MPEGSILEDHVGDVACHVAVLDESFQAADGGHKDMILDLCMLTEPHLVLIDVVQGGSQLVVVQPVLR